MLLGHLSDGAMEGLLQKASEPREDALAGARLAVLPSLEYFFFWSGILARAPSQ